MHNDDIYVTSRHVTSRHVASGHRLLVSGRWRSDMRMLKVALALSLAEARLCGGSDLLWLTAAIIDAETSMRSRRRCGCGHFAFTFVRLDVSQFMNG